MTEFLYFLGRFHVLLLHLPIGILLLAVLMEIASRTARFRHLAPSLNVVWLLGAVSAILTAMLGYLHASEGGFDGAAVNAHRIAGTTLAVLATVVCLLRTRTESLYAKAWPIFSIAIVAALMVTGHFGGNLTHGDSYLAMPRSQPKDIGSADIYADIVAPALAQRCSGCHNDSKRKGQLSVASYEKLMKGGEHGPVIVAGDLNHSDLIRRISLPPTDKDFMPRDGKTPLSAEQTTAIRWWVSAGAPGAAKVSTLQAPADVLLSLEAASGLRKASPATTNVARSDVTPSSAAAGDTSAGNVSNGNASATNTATANAAASGATTSAASAARQARAEGAEPPAAREIVLPDIHLPAPDPAVLDALEAKGFVVRAMAADSPLVQVDYTASSEITDADLVALAKIARYVYSLNLREAGVSDGQLATLGSFENLTHLRLELNPITDDGLTPLRGLKHLESLNLYGTKVGDAGLKNLAGLSTLRRLFVWRTAVTPSAIAAIRHSNPGLLVVAGFDPKTFPEGPRIIPVVN